MALSNDVQRMFEKGDRNAFPLKAAAKCYQGAAIGIEIATGYARPLVAGDLFVGFAEENYDNTSGANGAIDVRVRDDEKVKLAISGLAITDLGKPVYASDDDTFTLTATNNSYVGKVDRFDSTGKGWVVIERCGIGGRLTDLTSAAGTAGAGTVDVTATQTQAAINNNFATLVARVNALAAMIK